MTRLRLPPLCLAVVLSSPLRPDDCSTPQATLKAFKGTVQPGVAPDFRLTLLNTCSHEIWIPSLNRLVATRLPLLVTQAGKQVLVPRSIADPPKPIAVPFPAQPSDASKLQPGEIRTFLLARFEEDLSHLEVGTYQVQVVFPSGPAPGFKSSIATFHVRRP